MLECSPTCAPHLGMYCSPECEESAATRNTGETLRAYAGHFSPCDWNWSRQHQIKRITYRPRRRGAQTRGGRHRWFDPSELPARLWSAGHYLFGSRIRSIFPDEPSMRPSRLRMARAALRAQNLPDGHLEEGGVVAYWEETGEYLQMVQPSVGLLVADFLEQEPEHPHARAIAAEIRRHQDRYRQRIAESGDSV
jgi:hypothetical protein